MAKMKRVLITLIQAPFIYRKVYEQITGAIERVYQEVGNVK